MSYTIIRRDFLKCALASAVVIPALGAAVARAAGLPLLDPADPVAQSLGFVPDASKARPALRRMHAIPGQTIRAGRGMQHIRRPLGSIRRLVHGVRPALTGLSDR